MKKNLVRVASLLLVVVLISACASSSSAPAAPAAPAPSGSATPAPSPSAANQDWPKETITWIVPFSAGGNSDTISRILAPYFAEELGVAINIVNQPGSAGELGTMNIAQAKPDGYTIGTINSPDIQISCAVNENYELDFHNDLNYLCTFTATPVSFYAPKDSEWNSLDKFVEYSKAHPGGIALGEGGIGHRVMMAKVMDYFDIQISSVNFNSVSDVVAAALGGHIDAASAGNQVIDQFSAGGWQPIAWGGSEKCAQFPDTPLFADMGLDVDFMGVMTVLMTPAGTPDYINERLVEIARKLNDNPKVREQLEAVNCVYYFCAGDEMRDRMYKFYDEVNQVCTEFKNLIVLNN